jgi:trimethylamine:corrinoid methyltransferase-like protein
MRGEFFQPELSNRDTREVWQEAGARDAKARAAERAREILDSPKDPVIPQEIRERIKRDIPGLAPSIIE